MPRVVYATHSAKKSGGARQLVVNARAMAAAGWDVRVAAAPNSETAQSLQGAAVDLEAEDFRGFPAALGTLARLCRDADVLHVFHAGCVKPALVLALLRPRLKVFLNRGVVMPPGLGVLLWRAATGVVCNSAACLAVLERAGLPAARLHLVYNALDLPETGPTAGAGVDARPEVLFIGDKRPHKGLDVFLGAVDRLLARNPDLAARFTVAGVKANPVFARHAAARTLERVAFLGGVPHTELMARMAGASVFCAPLREGFDSFPNTVSEAGYYGLPTVASRVAGVPELLVDGVNGLLVPPGDPETLAAALGRVLDDAALGARLGAAARRLVHERLRPERKAALLARVYAGEPGVRDEPPATAAK